MTLPAEYEVMRLLDAIEREPGRNEKENLVEELASKPLGSFALKWAYDPFVTFGIRVGRRDPAVSGTFEFKQGAMNVLLEKLAHRKLTGRAAEREIAEVMDILTDSGAELLFRILNKDLKCGISTSTINKVVPNLIPVFSVMRANKFEEKRIKKWPVAVEPKLDGFRYTFVCRGGHAGFFTRSGKRAPSCDHMIGPMMDAATRAVTDFRDLNDLLYSDAEGFNFVVDGEMMAGESFNETSGALRRQSEEATEARFHIFDIMSFAEFDAIGTVNRPYSDRREHVCNFVASAVMEGLGKQITKPTRYLATSHEQIMEFYEKFRDRGFEGAMVKLLDGGYDKKKSYGWLKIKPEETEDLPIIGAFPGELHTKYENCLGGLVVLRDGVRVRVGGGFSDVQRQEIWDLFQKDLEYAGPAFETDKDAIIIEESELSSRPNVMIGRLIEIQFHEVTPDGSLRHPRFVRFRDDKAGEVEDKEAA